MMTKSAVEKWINDSDENRRFFTEAQKIWENSGVRLVPVELDSQQLVRELKVRIAREQKPMSEGSFHGHAAAQIILTCVAAGICLLLASYLRNTGSYQ
jgi:ferric-dicitrate binding protein FerR (iron transport regulator)